MSDVAPTGRSLAWFHCFSGIAGDMALASLLDAGADVDGVRTLLERLPLPGWHLELQTVLRGGVACTRALVSARDDVIVRTHAHIVGLLAEARLPERVTARSLAIFSALAEVEGRLHRRSSEQVHFHEVGGHDAVIDIVGTVCALEVLGVDTVSASAVATGSGMVRSAHGMLPNPSPAVVRLLEGAPTYGRPTPIELTTPTGAAILAALAESFGPLPEMVVSSSGFGAGSNELEELPNCTQVVLGTTAPAGVGRGQAVAVLEANLDDATGEQLAHAVARLVEGGAHDAWLTPVVMKKGRPGHVLHVLCDLERIEMLGGLMKETTGTLGVRAYGAERWPSSRDHSAVHVEGEWVAVKASRQRTKAEFDDVARVARSTGIGVHEVASQAEAAWRRQRQAEETDDPGPA